MPIRFRCVYCEQLLGIARRKAGTVVKCPNCGGQLIVPPPEELDAGEKTLESNEADEPAEPKIQAPKGGTAKHQPAPVAAQSPAGGGEGAFLFERSDFDELLKPAGEKKPALAGSPSGKMAAPQTIEPALDLAELEPLYNMPTSAQQMPGAEAPLIQPAAKPPAKRSGIFLSPLRLTIALFFIVLALAGAFGGGLLVGMKIAAKKMGG
jgi:phage FluMu protein Com